MIHSQNDISFELAEKVSDPAVGQVAEDTHSSRESAEFNKKSVRTQVEELATARSLKTDISFTKPPGFKYNIG